MWLWVCDHSLIKFKCLIHYICNIKRQNCVEVHKLLINNAQSEKNVFVFLVEGSIVTFIIHKGCYSSKKKIENEICHVTELLPIMYICY